MAIDSSRIAHVYCVAVVDHPTLDKWGAGSSFECESRTISAMTTTHAELQHIVTELSTAGDFIDYLQAREAFFAKNQMMGISELDLLAFYKSDPEEFLRHIENAGCCHRRRRMLGRVRKARMSAATGRYGSTVPHH